MDPFIGEIRIFAGNFPPQGWAFCNGQMMKIVENTALFSLLGTTYGGDGKSTFALPNLQDRVPMHRGQGNGLTPRSLGVPGGDATVTLSTAQMPGHTHAAQCSDAAGTATDPTGRVWAKLPAPRGQTAPPFYTAQANTNMDPNALRPVGESQPHTNMQPHLGLNFIIALQGIYPPRT